MKFKRTPLIILIALVMILQCAIAFAGTNNPYVTEYGLYEYTDTNSGPLPAIGTVKTTGCDGVTWVEPTLWPTLADVPPVFEGNTVIGIKFAVNVATPTHYDSNITKFHMYDASNNVVAITVKRAGDGTNTDVNRNYFYVTPQNALKPGSAYKIVVDPGITANNGVSTTISQEVNFTTTAATTTAPELTAGDASGAPGAVIQVPVTLTSSGEVVAMQFDLSYDSNLLTYQQRSKGSLTSEFSVSTNKLENNDIRVVIYHDQNIPIATGSGTVVQLQFQVAAAAPAGGTSVLELKGVILSNADEQPITTNVNNGQFTVLQPPDTTAPSVSSSDPVSGVAGVAIDKTIAITFSEDILAGDAYNQISLKDASNNSVAFGKSISGNVLSLNPDANLGYSSAYTVTVPAGAVEDAAGNGLASAYTMNFTTSAAPDTTAPSVISSDPVSGATGVAIDKTVAITFSEDILAGDAYNQISLKDASNNSVAFGKSISGNVLSLDPDANLAYSSAYTVTVPAGAVEDAAGNGLASAYTMNFTTRAAPDTTAPSVSSSDPVDGATGVAIDKTIAITFSENILEGSAYGQISLKDGDNNSVLFAKSIINNVLRLDPSSNLGYNSNYTVVLPANAVKDQDGNELADKYELVFTTTSGPTITVISPNGNESWTAGTSQTISWNYTGSLGSYVKIELLKGGVVDRVINSSRLLTSGMYTWTIPTAQPSGHDYSVRVTSNSNSSYTDTSDATFTIVGPPAPSITVAAPNGSETWAAGTKQTISWNYTGSPGTYVKIELLKGGVVDLVISSSRPISSGAYVWTIPSTLASGDDYSVRVTSNSYSSCTDTSDATFTIVGPPAPSITVATPNGSETWAAGTKQTISWNYTGSPGSYVKIELLKGGIVDRVISSSRSISSGSYTWTIPTSQASGDDYSVRVTSRSNSSYTDTSDDTFTIIGPPAPSITVATPNGSETWEAGTKQTISWNYTGSPGSYVKIELLKGGIVDRLISSSRPINSGKYQWTLPSTLASGDDYSVRVTSRSNSSYTDTSDATFTIVGPPAPSITVAAPNGSEAWVAGTKQTISWNYTGSPGSYVKIELLKGGVVDRVISSSRPITSGKYQWTIPTTLASGDDYSVRVTSRSNASYTGTSDATFTIVGPPAPSITVAAPNGSETWAAGTKQTISWNYTGSPGSYVKIELLKGGVFNRLISSSKLLASGAYTWTIPTSLASGDDYSVRVTSRSNSSYTDSSDASFTITEVSDQ